MFLSIVESNVRRNEAKSLDRIGLKELADPPSQDGANEDVRVENNHLSSSAFCRVGAAL